MYRAGEHVGAALAHPRGPAFRPAGQVKDLRRAGMIGFWPVQVGDKAGGTVAGLACALRKTRQAICIAHKALRRQASKKGPQLQPQTLEFAKLE